MEKVIKLKYPIGEINELKVTRLKAKHLRKLPSLSDGDDSGKVKLSADQILAIVALMNNIESEILDDLDLDDLTEIMEKVKSFL